MDKDVTIILGDSDRGHSVLFKRHLQQWGFKYPILRFSDGQGVLDFLHWAREGDCRISDRMYLVMMTLSMLLMGGLDVLKAMKQDPDFKNMPVIILTNTKDEKNTADCLDAGCDAILEKPLEKEAFTRALANIGVIKMPFPIA
ncbi:MAG: response regulator [Planctomycetes bacterium]|nr:response regulator [Planctomycetota bacterium]